MKARPGFTPNMAEKMVTSSIAAPKEVESTDDAERYSQFKNATISFNLLTNSRPLKEGERLVRM